MRSACLICEHCVLHALLPRTDDVVSDPVKREIYDRLGADGLDRLRDGDPSVHRDFEPPPAADGIDRLTAAIHRYGSLLRDWFGMSDKPPVVSITATDATGRSLQSGGALTAAGQRVTFKFVLSARPYDKRAEALSNLMAADIQHTCPRGGARFLGMKQTYYLECPHTEGESVLVRVPAGAFEGRLGKKNTASPTFTLLMI